MAQCPVNTHYQQTNVLQTNATSYPCMNGRVCANERVFITMPRSFYFEFEHGKVFISTKMNTQNNDRVSLTKEYDRIQQCLLTAYNQVLESEASELQSNIQTFNTELDSFQFAITIMDKWKESLEKKRESINESMTVHVQKRKH